MVIGGQECSFYNEFSGTNPYAVSIDEEEKICRSFNAESTNKSGLCVSTELILASTYPRHHPISSPIQRHSLLFLPSWGPTVEANRY